MTITLAQANQIIAGTHSEGARLGLRPLTVAVLDAGGHLTAFQKADGSPTLRHAIAIGKAAAALGLGVSSRRVGEMAAERPHFVAAVGALCPSGFVPAPGGVIVVGDEARALGAVGVSGDTSENDELCALAGIAAASLKAQI
jgi:uncharacterized protein GlcG (DUF336 family)